MPILSLDKTSLERKCAACGRTENVRVDALVLGAAVGPKPLPDLIVLPACSCGAIEQLRRTWDETPAGFAKSEHEEHRRAVNALAEELRSTGKSHQLTRALHNAETKKPPSIVDISKRYTVGRKE